jgi:hypothetical protein
MEYTENGEKQHGEAKWPKGWNYTAKYGTMT